MMTNYSVVYLGDANDATFFLNENDGAVVTFQHIYRHLVLVALVQRTMLLNATWRLSALIDMPDGKPVAPKPSDVDEFYVHFLRFTQKMWFFEVTPQEQGQKLFAELQRHLRSKELYDEVRQELHDMVEHSMLAHNAEQTRVTTTLTKLAGVLGAIGVAAGILGMNTFDFKDTWWLFGQQYKPPVATMDVTGWMVNLPMIATLVVVLVCLLPVICFLSWNGIKKHALRHWIWIRQKLAGKA